MVEGLLEKASRVPRGGAGDFQEAAGRITGPGFSRSIEDLGEAYWGSPVGSRER